MLPIQLMQMMMILIKIDYVIVYVGEVGDANGRNNNTSCVDALQQMMVMIVH